MNDLQFQKVVTAWMASEAYKRLRNGTAGESTAAAPRDSTTEARPKLQIVQPHPEDRYVTCVPLVPLKAAAGAFSDPQHVEDDNWEWVAVDAKRHLRPGMFVAQVVGKSMEPTIADGSYCLFRAPVIGTRQGKIVLVQLRNAIDPDNGERYTVKRYQSEKVTDGDSWRHARITLKSINPDFQPIELTGSEEGELQVVAELVEVLGGTS
jgi:phage repressor protein C with HTH and peptisase S24 domain